jgi:hypothetical protein
MNTIHKYVLSSGRMKIALPIGAKVLTVQRQGEDLCLWAVVDSSQQREMRVFEVFGTGHQMPDGLSKFQYISTVQEMGGALVWHVFETTGAD